MVVVVGGVAQGAFVFITVCAPTEQTRRGSRAFASTHPRTAPTARPTACQKKKKKGMLRHTFYRKPNGQKKNPKRATSAHRALTVNR